MLGQDVTLIPQIVGFLDVPKLFPLQPKPLCFPLTAPLASQNPEMPLSFTRCRVIRLLLLYYLGLLPFVPIPEKFLLCFLPTIINRCLQGPHLPSPSSPRLPAASVLRKTPPISSPIL